MTPEQRDHILAVIDKDANGHGWLALMRDGEPQVCILGGLAIEAGWTFEQLENKTQPSHVRTRVDGETLFRRLKTLFGLAPGHRQQLINDNDCDGYGRTMGTSREQYIEWLGGIHDRRRARLRELVNSWQVS